VPTDPIREFIANEDVGLGTAADVLDIRELITVGVVAAGLAGCEVDADALRRGGVVGCNLAGSAVQAVRAGAAVRQGELGGGEIGAVGVHADGLGAGEVRGGLAWGDADNDVAVLADDDQIVDRGAFQRNTGLLKGLVGAAGVVPFVGGIEAQALRLGADLGRLSGSVRPTA